jgi:hypothetical protein
MAPGIGALYGPPTPTTDARSIAAMVIAGDRRSRVAVRSAPFVLVTVVPPTRY